MGLAFVPLYIKYLGIEAYGLIGLYAVLQAWLSLLDMGLTPALGREMGRYTGGSGTRESIRDLLRSVEIIACMLACFLALCLWFASDWLAAHWLMAENLPENTVAQAITYMGLVTALRFLEGIYRSCLIGLQQQIFFNVVNSVLATVRALGAVAVLAFYSNTISAFFIWQAAVSVLSLSTLLLSTYYLLGGSPRSGRFSWVALRGVGRYAGGMMGITFLSLLLTQVDKILLSRLLTLSEFGYYTLAAVVAGSLYILLAPIVQAWFPRLSQLYAANSHAEFVEAYHLGAQLVTVLMGSATLVFLLYSDTILELWISDHETVKNSSTLVKWLALGNLLNGMMTIPYQAQLAYGWTGYAIRVNTISVILIVPAIFLLVPIYGATAAAVVWVCLNAGYIIFGAQYMYSRMLKAERNRWYSQDILRPMLYAIFMAFLVSQFSFDQESRCLQALEVVLGGLFITAAALFGADRVLRSMRLAILEWK